MLQDYKVVLFVLKENLGRINCTGTTDHESGLMISCHVRL